MKSFLIKRTSKVEVGMTDISAKDIESMTTPKLKLYANAMRIMMNKINTNVEHTHVIVEGKPMVINHQPTTVKCTDLNEPENDSNHGRLGCKNGKTSKYHYVYWHRNGNQWKGALKVNGVSKYAGSFEYEEEAAISVDSLLDSINDEIRPRNRNEFPEIKNLHNKDKK